MIEIAITAKNLPTGNFWEEDGACWHYIRDHREPKGFRLQPQNLKAFAKSAPDGPMTDFYPASAQAGG